MTGDGANYLLEDNYIDVICTFLYRSNSKYNNISERNYFVNITNELMSSLEKMSLSSDKRFINLLIDNLRCQDYIDDLNDDSYSSLFLKTYIVLMGYKVHYDDFDTYKVLVEDVGAWDNNKNFLSFANGFRSLKRFIDFIIENKCYKEMPNLRRTLYDVYSCFSVYSNHLVDYYEVLDLYNTIYKDAEEACCDVYDVSMIVDILLGDMFTLKNDYFYCKSLLLNGRFEYLNDKLIEIEDRYCIREDIFSYIKDLSVDLFNELNSNSKYDSFISCFDKVFDSDSYYELLSKLNLLKEASNLYEDGQKELAFYCIKKLDSLDHKKVYNGEFISYPVNCMNRVSKPKTIYEREEYLYSVLDSSLSYGFMDEVYFNADSIDKLVDDIDSAVERENLPFNKFKKRIKGKLDIFRG